MAKLKKFLVSVVLALYIIGIFFLIWRADYATSLLGTPDIFVPAIAFVGVLLLAFRSVKEYLKMTLFEEEFTLVVNHTFRTPLTRIQWLTKELEKEMPQKERLEYLQDLENATTRLLDIVDLFAGIKNINDVSGYFFEATSVRLMVERSIEKYRSEINKKELNFKIPTFQNVPMLTVDLKKISFVIDTLIENAVFYTPKKGNIIIDCNADKNKLSLYVADNGIGLSFLEKYRLFDRFHRSKKAVLANPNGMGLRLYLAKQIVKRHKGKIFAKSHGKNKGTTFFLELPFQR